MKMDHIWGGLLDSVEPTNHPDRIPGGGQKVPLFQEQAEGRCANHLDAIGLFERRILGSVTRCEDDRFNAPQGGIPRQLGNIESYAADLGRITMGNVEDPESHARHETCRMLDIGFQAQAFWLESATGPAARASTMRRG